MRSCSKVMEISRDLSQFLFSRASESYMYRRVACTCNIETRSTCMSECCVFSKKKQKTKQNY